MFGVRRSRYLTCHNMWPDVADHTAERDTLKTERDAVKTERDALKAEVDRLEKLTGKAAKPPAASGGGDKKLTADEWLAEELKKGK